MTNQSAADWKAHLETLRTCALCPEMEGPPVTGVVQGARIFLMGQAPGPRERDSGRPFVWSAGKTLFRWFASIGVEEACFRERVYMGAAARCFPGRLPGKSGDRKPSPAEVERCGAHFERELALLKPALVIAVGRLALDQFLTFKKLDEVVGQTFEVERQGHWFTCLPPPHPSGLSRWIQTDDGKARISAGLKRLATHPVWRETFGE